MIRFSSMELYIFRHGEAGKRLPAGMKDSERGLTVAGADEVKQVAEGLASLEPEFDVIATSPLKRSVQTLDIIAKTLKNKKGRVERWDELKPEGSRLDLYKKLGGFKQESSILIVGHEPYLSAMISEIIFGNAAGGIVLKKSGAARIDVSSMHPKPKGQLRWLLTPKLLRRMAK